MTSATRRYAPILASLALLLGLAAVGCQSDDPVAPESQLPGDITVTPDGVSNAPWFLIQPDKDVVEGTGGTTLADMPRGTYKLVWAPIAGWYSPTPNPLEQVLAPGGEITFSATYTEIEVETGSIAIDAEPDEINAPWTITGPSGFSFSGQGDLVLAQREPGQYTVTFGDVPNYETAGAVQGTLVAGSRLDLGGSYIYQAPPSLGTILVDVNPDGLNAPWTVSGPNGFFRSGNGDESLAEIELGTYTINFTPVSGWELPVPAMVTHVLTDGELFSATGTYTIEGTGSGAAPTINNISGNFANGGSVTIDGEGFGNLSIEVASSLGPDGWIESNSPGTRFDQLQGAQDWRSFSANQPAFIDNSRAHSGSRSINGSIDRSADNDWNKVIYYTKESKFDQLYATWWVYFNPTNYSDTTQWKIWRVGDEGGNEVATDNCGSLIQSSHWAPGYNAKQYATIFHCKLGCQWPAQAECYKHIQPQPWYAPEFSDPYNYQWHNRAGTVSYNDNLPTQGEWCRAEIFLDASDIDTPNGRYWLTIQRPGEFRRIVDNWVTGLTTHRSDCCSGDGSGEWENFVLQGFFDDNGGPFQDEEADLFYDDIYLQFGSPARVELGNSDTYATCTQLEVQETVSWSDGQVQIKLNRGGMNSGSQAWLFVIDENGNASDGRPVTITVP